MLNKAKNKVAYHLFRALYGTKNDFACCFFGEDPYCKPILIDSASVGIVFQGPINDEEKLLVGLAQYRRLLPESSILVSTWRGAVGDEFRHRLDGLNIGLVENTLPAISGILNVNKQIVSTAQGIKILGENAGIKYIAKARTDFFPWRPDKGILQMLTLSDLLRGDPRIWGVDFNTRMDLPFSFSDLFQIGPIDLMSKYWRNDILYLRDISVKRFLSETDKQRDKSAILRLQPPEIYLARRYLERLDSRIDFYSLDDYVASLTKYFGVLDSRYIEMVFGKYSLILPGCELYGLREKEYLKFSDWLSMNRLGLVFNKL